MQNDKVKSKKEIEKIEHLKKLVEEYKNKYLRALADYHNLEKRVEEERSLRMKVAKKDLILQLLPIFDLVDKALKDAEENRQQVDSVHWREGIKIAIKEFRNILSREGFEPVETETFDPNLHEAVGVRLGPEGKILDVLQMGYKLNGKLVKPAKVVVGKNTI